MSRIAIPALDAVPEASKPILDAVHKQLGVVPNMYRLMAQNPDLRSTPFNIGPCRHSRE
jgi:hypothetical protein